MQKFIATTLPNDSFQYRNTLICNINEKYEKYALIDKFCYVVEASPLIKRGFVAINLYQRENCKIKINNPVEVTFLDAPPIVGEIKECTIIILPIKRLANVISLDIIDAMGAFIISDGQRFAIDGLKIDVTIYNVTNDAKFGFITENTVIDVISASPMVEVIKPIKANDYESPIPEKKVFKTNFDFSNMNVGGMDTQMIEMFRRAFASRTLPPKAVERLGIKHVKGILLYGPPGCGKTLIARMLSKCLNSSEPIIVNGPELKNRFVGQSEENVRKLFEPAENDFKKNGKNAQLHVIIFDEFDALGGIRGQSTNTHNDGIVNQLLTKIDGVSGLPNVLLIAMTNRKDMLDPALIRPGRFELHIEIGLPDEQGREQILNIYTKKLIENKNMSENVSIADLAKLTKNFTGAELESLVGTAKSYALSEHIDIANSDKIINIDEVVITQKHIYDALLQTTPMFGRDDANLQMLYKFGITHYSNEFTSMYSKITTSIINFECNAKNKLNILFTGETKTGKTALSANIMVTSQIPFVRYISGFDLIGKHDFDKSTSIKEHFLAASKTPFSGIIIDDLEILIEFNEYNHQFSNSILQTFVSLIKKAIDTKMVIIMTCNNMQFLQKTKIVDLFDHIIKLGAVPSPETPQQS